MASVVSPVASGARLSTNGATSGASLPSVRRSTSPAGASAPTIESADAPGSRTATPPSLEMRPLGAPTASISASVGSLASSRALATAAASPPIVSIRPRSFAWIPLKILPSALGAISVDRGASPFGDPRSGRGHRCRSSTRGHGPASASSHSAKSDGIRRTGACRRFGVRREDLRVNAYLRDRPSECQLASHDPHRAYDAPRLGENHISGTRQVVATARGHLPDAHDERLLRPELHQPVPDEVARQRAAAGGVDPQDHGADVVVSLQA